MSPPIHRTMSDDTLRRHQAFWRHDQMDRPSWGVSVGFFANEAYPRLMARMPSGPAKPENILVDELLADFDDRFAAQKGIGDFPFTCSPFPSIPWLEAIAGCPIMASPTSFWAEPCLTDFATWRWDDNVLKNPWAQKMLELMKTLVKHSQGRYQVSPSLMRGPADILAAMRGASQFAMDFLDTPERIRPALDHCAVIWREMARAQLDMIPPSDEGYLALESALRAWAPERLLWLQEDAMALLSPKLYREFVLPLDMQLSAQFPCIAFHLHGTALWAVDSLVQVPGINAIELNLEAAFCDVPGTLAGWKKIQAHKPLVIWRAYADDFPAWLDGVLRDFPAQGISIQVSTRNAAEARKVEAEFRKHNRD